MVIPHEETTQAIAAANSAHDGGAEVAATAQTEDLLRSWRNPPVAPAVVVAEDTTSSNVPGSPRCSYPVATFVQNLARSSIDLIHQAHTGQADYPLSIRSDGTAIRQDGSGDNNADAAQFPLSARTVEEFMDDDQEFVVVNGDLVMMTPPPPNEREMRGLEAHRREEANGGGGPRQTCVRQNQGRLKRNIKRFNRFFKRGNKKDKSASSVYNADSCSNATASERSHVSHSAAECSSRAGAASGLTSAVTGLSPPSALDPPACAAAASTSDSSLPPPPPGGKVATPKKRPGRLKLGAWRRNNETPAPLRGCKQQCNQQSSALTSTSDHGSAAPSPPFHDDFRSDDSFAPSVAASAATMSDPLPMHPPALIPAQTGVAADPLSALSSHEPRAGAAASIPAAAVQAASLPEPSVATAAMASSAPAAQGHHQLARAASVTASFVGTADQLLEAGVLPAGIAAEAYLEFEDDPKKDGYYCPPSVIVARGGGDASDYKVSKDLDAPDFEDMLRRAAMETTNDLGDEPIPPQEGLRFRGKSDRSSTSSIPLSISCASDSLVHNDLLKVTFVGCLLEKTWLSRTIRNKSGRPRKRTTLAVDVQTWTYEPQAEESLDEPPVKFSLWDVQGVTSCIEGSPNFGGHASTQSLFFSNQSLYVLVWDLAQSKPKTYRKKTASDGRQKMEEADNDEDEDDYEYEDDFVNEENLRQADRALQADIQNRVLSWVDCIARRGGQGSAILPVAVIPEAMSQEEVKRRCSLMQKLLEEHQGGFHGNRSAPTLLTGADNIVCVSYGDSDGIEQLRRTIVAIATDSSAAVFNHVGKPVPASTVFVFNILRKLKKEHKLILLDHLLAEVGSKVPVEEVVDALHFLSNLGEILYFGTAHDEVLSRYIILSLKWLVSALSCILRNDLKRELIETRRFMNMQCLYSTDQFPENEMAQALLSGTTSSCPLLSDSDARMLWNSMTFMREAADKYSQLAESSTSAPSMFYFLERLLVHSEIFVPLKAPSSDALSVEKSEVFFVPSLLAKVDPREIWTFRTRETWLTTLCHSWLFRSGAPCQLMERITATLLEDLYEFSREFPGSPVAQAPQRTHTVPVGRNSFNDFYEEKNEQAIGRVRIHDLMCWQASVLIKIGFVYADKETNELRESHAEILIAIVDQTSSLCVASDAMRSGMHRVVVSGRGQVGNNGRKLWKGGYKVVVDSVRSVVGGYSNVDSQVVCPDCIAHSHPHNASTWVWDDVLAVAESGSGVVRCMRKGHRVDSCLLCGICEDPSPAVQVDTSHGTRHVKPASDILPSVVLVGLWDPKETRMRSVGSGFIVDRKIGLVVTAAHTLFNMAPGRHFGARYFGVRGCQVAVGVIPDEGEKAVFRYLGEVVADDTANVDACVVRITARLENDVDDDGAGVADQVPVALALDAVADEKLKNLKLMTRFQLEESVRVMGFNQGGEGVLEKGKHVNRSVDLAKGYIAKRFMPPDDDSSQSSDDYSSCQYSFSPREEIVIMCPTISGHSGGPCVNEEGKVVGILSRADPDERQRCYLVPSSEIRILLSRARKACTRPPQIPMQDRMI